MRSGYKVFLSLVADVLSTFFSNGMRSETVREFTKALFEAL